MGLVGLVGWWGWWGGGVQHTLFGHGSHIYPTQTKDKKVLPCKALYGENPELVSVLFVRPPAAVTHAAAPPQESGIYTVYNPFSPVSSSSLFPNLNQRRRSASCPEYMNTPYFIFMSAFQLRLVGISVLLVLFCLSHDIQRFEGDLHDSKKFHNNVPGLSNLVYG